MWRFEKNLNSSFTVIAIITIKSQKRRRIFMKKVYLIFLSLLAFVFLFIGCGSKCPECPELGSYSTCNDQAIKTRTNYRCSEATNLQCESYTEETQCATEVKLQGNLDTVVKPSIEENVKGIIKIEVKGAPEDTTNVAYWLDGGDLPPIGPGRGPSLASEQGGVWTAMIDTTEYKNGLYTINTLSTNQELDQSDTPPTAYAQGQIVISN